jgi:opacity protein-like surface antigen
VTYGDGFGVQWQVGYKTLGGGWSDLLDSGYDADINLFYNHRKLRLGVGGNFASFDLQEPLQDESMSSVEAHGFLGYHFLRGPFQPYVQGRVTWVRLRPEGHDFASPVDPDDESPEQLPEEGENVGERRSGFGLGGVAGFEYRISYGVGLEAMVSYDRFGTQDVDLTEFGFEDVFSEGTIWGFRAGINWYP